MPVDSIETGSVRFFSMSLFTDINSRFGFGHSHEFNLNRRLLSFVFSGVCYVYNYKVKRLQAGVTFNTKCIECMYIGNVYEEILERCFQVSVAS